jgi:hypothetical protein
MTHEVVPTTSANDLRKVIKDWCREAVKRSGKRVRTLTELMGEQVPWLSLRLSPSVNVALSQRALVLLSRLTRQALPAEVLEARAQLDEWVAAGQAKGLPPIRGQLPDDCLTAEAEMACLIELAHEDVGEAVRARNIEFMRQRFGLGTGQAQTLEQVGQQFSLTRERVRQIEAKMLSRLAAAAESLATPRLDEVVAVAMQRRGMPIAAVHAELAPVLGAVALTEALRFVQELRPPEEELATHRAQIYGQTLIPVLVTDEAQARRTLAVSVAARKLVSYSGACLVADLRVFVENRLGEPIDLQALRQLVEALPDHQWLGSGRRWFWFRNSEYSPMLTRVAIILAIAQAPVDIETLYAGLVRGADRPRDSESTPFCDPIPPSAIVQDILDNHPDFQRRIASAYALNVPFDALENVEGVNRQLIPALEQSGGVATRQELAKVQRLDGRAIGREHLGMLLSMSPYLERRGPGVYAFRGRQIPDEVMQAAMDRSRAQIPAHFGISTQRRAESAHGSFAVRVPVTEGLKRTHNVFLRRSDVPFGANGEYRQDAGNATCRLIEDSHGIRLRRLGAAINQAIAGADVGSVLVLRFDLETKTMDWEVVSRPEEARPAKAHSSLAERSA